MSFGFSPSDIVTLISLATKAYKGWNNACGEYADVTGTLKSLQILLERIHLEVNKPGSILVARAKDSSDLNDLLRGCRAVVKELDAVLGKFRSLSSSRKKNWDKFRFGVKNLDGLRARLTQHITTLTAYLETVGLGSLARIESQLDSIPDEIQQSIDNLAAEIRAGRREGSVWTTHEDDEKDVWCQFRRELVGDGITSSTISRFKPQIKQYLQTLAEDGLLDEEVPPEYGNDHIELSDASDRKQSPSSMPFRPRTNSDDEKTKPDETRSCYTEADGIENEERSGSDTSDAARSDTVIRADMRKPMFMDELDFRMWHPNQKLLEYKPLARHESKNAIVHVHLPGNWWVEIRVHKVYFCTYTEQDIRRFRSLPSIVEPSEHLGKVEGWECHAPNNALVVWKHCKSGFITYVHPLADSRVEEGFNGHLYPSRDALGNQEGPTYDESSYWRLPVKTDCFRWTGDFFYVENCCTMYNPYFLQRDDPWFLVRSSRDSSYYRHADSFRLTSEVRSANPGLLEYLRQWASGVARSRPLQAQSLDIDFDLYDCIWCRRRKDYARA